jgi:Domain of Unknown Function (DUF1080)
MKPLIRPNGRAVNLQSNILRIDWVIVTIVVLNVGLAVSAAQSNSTAAEKGTEQVVQPINFRQPAPLDFDDHVGYERIFDGKSLKDWDGDPSFWHVENGAIVGVSTKEHPVGNTYIVFRGFEAKDFDLKLEIKVENGGGSGIQYRSKTGIPWRRPAPNVATNLDWLLTGPQADIWYPVDVLGSMFSGQFYSENTPLGILAWRGQVVNSSPGLRPRLVGNIGDRFALGGYVRNNAWNEYLIMARGGTFIHIMNGQLMAVYVDDDSTSSNNQPGLIGIELEQVPSKVSVRNIWIKKLPVSLSALAVNPAPYDSIAGTWKLKRQIDAIEMADPQVCTFHVKEQQYLTGSCTSENGSQELVGQIHGKSVSWQLDNGRPGSAVFTGTIDSDSSIAGTYEVKQGTILGDFTFTARRTE